MNPFSLVDSRQASFWITVPLTPEVRSSNPFLLWISQNYTISFCSSKALSLINKKQSLNFHLSSFLPFFLPILNSVLIFSTQQPQRRSLHLVTTNPWVPPGHPSSRLPGWPHVSVSVTLSVPTHSVRVIAPVVVVRARALVLWGARVFGAGLWDHAVWTVNLYGGLW